jgi:hypothetical protein
MDRRQTLEQLREWHHKAAKLVQAGHDEGDVTLAGIRGLTNE